MRPRQPDNDRFLRQSELLRQLGVSRATLYRWRQSGHFPKALRIGPKILAWRENDVLQWLRDRPRA
jgi:prophage regulatory protein